MSRDGESVKPCDSLKLEASDDFLAWRYGRVCLDSGLGREKLDALGACKCVGVMASWAVAAEIWLQGLSEGVLSK
jgi:hypothetical protein